MPRAGTKRQMRIGLEHLRRFAFETRDNPFVARQGSLGLAPPQVRELQRLLDREIEVATWLASDAGKTLLTGINVGSLPRDVQLLFRDGEPVVGVDSVHAFLHARTFWWLVSILWSLSIATAVDPLLGDGVLGFRFRKAFLDDPSSSGLMFADQRAARKRWKELPGEVRKQHPGEFLTAAKLDLRAFYYAIDAGPDEIMRAFFAAKGVRRPRSPRLRVLTELLEALHQRYAENCTRVAPRKADLGTEGARPLPVGLPSSQVLANMIVSLVVDELGARDAVAVGAYADDLLVMTRTLPQLREAPAPFLARLGLIETESPYELRSASTSGLGRLITSEEKMEVSYSRYLSGEDAEEVAARKSFLERIGISGDDWEDYAEDDNDWGGRLTTVLRTAHKRERVPRRLRNELLGLLDEVRYGLAPDETAKRFEELLGELDRRLFVALRSYWTELIVIGIAAKGLKAVPDLTTVVREIIETVTLPDGTTKRGYQALRFGLRHSWYQALAQAIAVATDESDRQLLLEMQPRVEVGLPTERSRTMRLTIQHAMRLRRRRLVPSWLVAVPLAEFSDWEGALIGSGAFTEFLAWGREQRLEEPVLDDLLRAVRRSPRFINLHESCLAIHLWAGHDDGDWLGESFAVLAAQPLVDEKLVTELRERAEQALEPDAELDVGTEEKAILRIGMPSMVIDESQLKATIAEDQVALGAIAKRSRTDLQQVVRSAAGKNVDLLVLPEWSVLPQLVPWLMDKSSGEQMLVIGGQVPERSATHYRNLLWTGIPLTDSAGHRACIVPPPRQKRFLSPREEEAIREAGLSAASSDRDQVKAFSWKGVSIASLICFEFADLEVRRHLRFEAALLTVSSLNHDWHYFDAVQDATTRDNYCLTVCVNTGAFPGTRMVRPTRSEKAVIASVHGSDDPALITREVDMRPILAALEQHLKPCDAIPGYEPADRIELGDYKDFPPV